MTPTGVLLVTPIFLWGVSRTSLLADCSRVALALHNARCGTPFWVTRKMHHCPGAPQTHCHLLVQLLVGMLGLSTVLAQDHFYSDFLSLHVTLLTPKSTRMTMQSCTPPKEGALGLSACRIDDNWGAQHSDWYRFAKAFQSHRQQKNISFLCVASFLAQGFA